MSIDTINRLGRKLDEHRPHYDRLDTYFCGKQSAEGFVAAVDTLTQQAAAVSGLPPAYFGIHGSEVASADAIRSSEATLVSKARRRQRAFGGAWEDAMRLAVLVRDGVQRPGMESLETIWRDPETRTVAQAADAAVK